MSPTTVIIILCCTFSVIQGAFHTRPNITFDTMEVVVRKWKNLESNVISGTDTVLKSVLPSIVRMGVENDLSVECSGSVLKMLAGIRDLKLWAIRMLDATGKPSGGQLVGNLGFLGSYQECLETSAPPSIPGGDSPFSGQYCLVEIRPSLPAKPWQTYLLHPSAPFDTYRPKTEMIDYLRNNTPLYYYLGFQVGVCIPSTCSVDDVTKIANAVTSRFDLQSNIRSCTTAEKEQFVTLDVYQLVVIGVLSFILLVVLVSSLLNYFFNKMNQDMKPTAAMRFARVLSLSENISRTLSLSGPEDQTLSCLAGIRFFSVTWIVLGHTYALLEPNSLRFTENQYRFKKSILFQAIPTASSAVETFFFITGLLLSYNIHKAFLKTGPSCINIPIMICRRIWRLFPGVMLGLGLTFLLPLLGSGPLWQDEAGTLRDTCQKSWWYIPLFINNFLPLPNMCLFHTWYVSVDLQLFLISLVYFFVLVRRPRLAVGLNVLLTIASIFATGYVSWHYKLLPTILIGTSDKMAFEHYFRYVYFFFYPHWIPYGVGLALGTFLAKSPELKISITKTIIFWSISCTLALSVIYGVSEWNGGRPPAILETVFYAGLHRLAWAVALAILVCLCTAGRAGWVKSLLSLKIYEPLNRMSYLVYIVHYLVIIHYNGSIKGIFDYTHANVVRIFVANLCYSFGIAFIFRIIYEGPLMGLEAATLALFKARRKTTPISIKVIPTSGIKSIPDNTATVQISKLSPNSERKFSQVITLGQDDNEFRNLPRRISGQVTSESHDSDVRRTSDNHYTLNLVLEGLAEAANDLHRPEHEETVTRKLSLKDKDFNGIVTTPAPPDHADVSRSYSTSSENESVVSAAQVKPPNVVLSPRFTILHRKHT